MLLKQQLKKMLKEIKRVNERIEINNEKKCKLQKNCINIENKHLILNQNLSSKVLNMDFSNKINK